MDTNYSKFRGKCYEYASALANSSDGKLRLVRGWYDCPLWGKQEHWWCVECKTGKIIDPTKAQFPSNGIGAYLEYDEHKKILFCGECGHEVREENAVIDGHHVFCSNYCYAMCIGMSQYAGKPPSHLRK